MHTRNIVRIHVQQHPFIHPIERVEYLTNHQQLLMVQPQRFDGSLKDMIYRVVPLITIFL